MTNRIIGRRQIWLICAAAALMLMALSCPGVADAEGSRQILMEDYTASRVQVNTASANPGDRIELTADDLGEGVLTAYEARGTYNSLISMDVSDDGTVFSFVMPEGDVYVNLLFTVNAIVPQHCTMLTVTKDGHGQQGNTSLDAPAGTDVGIDVQLESGYAVASMT